MWEREDLIYFAGLFDGEGCISIKKRIGLKAHHNPTYWLELTIGMTHQRTILWLKSIFGGDIKQRKLKPPHNDCFVWRLTCKGAVLLLFQVEPFLRTKKTQAEHVLQFCKFNEGISKGLFPTQRGYKLPSWVVEKREDYFQKLKALRGAA